MAVFSNFHLFLPGALSRRGLDRISNFSAAAARVAAAVGELGLFLWMSLALAFSLLVTAGFFV
jgi:hypothetical protein